VFLLPEDHCFSQGFYKRKEKKKLKNHDKLLAVSITISVWCFDILLVMLDIMTNLIKENCVLCKIYIFSVVTLNKLIKECLS
jgi:hypothetical protein